MTLSAAHPTDTSISRAGLAAGLPGTIVSRLCALPQLETLYRDIIECGPGPFFSRCLERLQVSVSVNACATPAIPPRGPVVIVANHPFGALDGIIMGALLEQTGRDFKIMGNYLIHSVPEARPRIIPVDPFDRRAARTRNIAPVKQALGWLAAGNTLGMFPAGQVAHYRVRDRAIIEPEWSAHAGNLIRRTRATVVPVYFSGRNSALFHCAGLIHPLLRTVLLVREMLRKRGARVSVFLGTPIPWQHLSAFTTSRAVAAYLRLRTLVLQNRVEATPRRHALPPLRPRRRTSSVPIAAPTDPELIRRDIEGLGKEHLLLRQGHFSAYIAGNAHIPAVLREIGRLREEAFRNVREGTGRELDLDRFDAHYLHLFLWDNSRARIAGAYRLGPTDRIIASHGTRGLYISELFRCRRAFYLAMNPALELGRSFISPDYQKQFNSLLLLWRAIGEYVSRNPHYRCLYGPVSISDTYHRLSKNLMMQFFAEQRRQTGLEGLVRPRRAPRTGKVVVPSIRDHELTIEHISALISEIERDGKGMPILLRQYLKFEGTILSFSVDRRFSDVTDSLLIVDLMKSDERMLKRFLGASGVEQFRKHHGTASAQAA